MSSSQQPRYLPTLTEVVDALPPSFEAGHADADAAGVLRSGAQGDVAQRVLQRLDAVLEQRLQPTLARLVRDHTQTLAVQLREELTVLVRECVSQAMKQEAAQLDFPRDRT